MAQRIRMSQLLSDQVITTTAKILNILQKILENIRFRARQSLHFRVNWSSTYKREEDSNFQLILLLKSLDDEDLVNWLNSTSKTKYNLPEIQKKSWTFWVPKFAEKEHEIYKAQTGFTSACLQIVVSIP